MAALAASSLRSIVSLHSWEDLILTYDTESDCRGGPYLDTEEDQMLYAQYLAGSIGDLCIRIVLARSGIMVDRSYRTQFDTKREDLLVNKIDKDNLPKITFTLNSNAKDVDEVVVGNLLRIFNENCS